MCCDWCLECSIIFFWSGKNSECLISSLWVSINFGSVDHCVFSHGAGKSFDDGLASEVK